MGSRASSPTAEEITASSLTSVGQNNALWRSSTSWRSHYKSHYMMWGAFLTIRTIRTILRDQAAGAGRRVMGVHPAETSQRCSGGGAVVYQGLSVRWHACPACGTSLHRGHNAAKRRERRGRSLQGGVALAASEY
jgi:putative transposase